jgi:hypothetical protein
MRGGLTITARGNAAEVLLPLELLASDRSRKAMAMAANHSTAKAQTQVRRAVAKQAGIGFGSVKAATKMFSATAASLTAEIKGTGSHLPLKVFKARQTARGVTAAPWNQRRLFASTFFVGKFGGDVFRRTGKDRFPIKKLWGPAIPKEMVKGASAAAFQGTVATALPPRVQHELARLLRR